MAKKRVTRKQLLKEPDEFLTFSRKLMNFCVEHTNYLAIGLGSIIALILLVTGMQYMSKQSDLKALALLGEATETYDSLKDGGDLEKAYEIVNQKFELILEKYSGKEAGKLARVKFADICFNAKKFDRAIGLYNQAMDDFEAEPFIKYRLLEGLGYTYGSKQDYKKAAKYFERIVVAQDAPAKDEALFNLAGIYAAMGLRDKSEEAYKKIVSDYKDSMYRKIAEEKIAG